MVTAPTTTEPDASTLADIERASTALLTVNDLPDGWAAVPTSPSADVDAARVDACFGRGPASPTEVLEARRVDSDDFAGPDESRPTVEHSVTVAPDEARALLAMAEVGTDGASECLVGVVQDVFEAELTPDLEELDGLTIGQITIDRVDDGSAPDTEVGYRLQIPLLLDGDRFVQYLDVLYHRQGRALSNLQFASFIEPFDTEIYAALRDVAISRLGRIGS